MEQKVEISKSHYALDLLARFNHFRNTNRHCDFVIRAGEKEMPVHRFVISASSEYFDAMLSHDTKESIEGVVEIKHVDPECIAKCVDFIYTGEASVSNEKQGDLMHVAHMMRLERLYNGIAVFLEKKLECQSFYRTREIANLYDCKQLVKNCNDFAMKHFREIAVLDDFKRLEADYVKFLLSSVELEETDEVKCKALMIWINYDSSRAASLFDLMKHVDFSNLSIPYRRFLTENEPAIASSTECLQYVVKSVFDFMNSESRDVKLEGSPGIIVLDNTSSKLKSFDISNKMWNDMQAIHQDMANQRLSVVLVEGFIYVFTKSCTTYRLCYRKPNAAWEQMASRNGNWGASVVLNGKIYFTDCTTQSNRIEIFDIQQNQWSFAPNRSSSLIHSAITAFQESIFLMGGMMRDSVSTVERYDPATSSWSNAPSLLQQRHGASATSLADTLYLFGGYFSPVLRPRFQQVSYAESVEILSAQSGSWQLVTLTAFKRQYFTSHTISGKIYLVGSSNSNFTMIDEYDPDTGSLTTVGDLTDMSMPCYSTGAALI